jgi:hypothetical protein
VARIRPIITGYALVTKLKIGRAKPKPSMLPTQHPLFVLYFSYQTLQITIKNTIIIKGNSIENKNTPRNVTIYRKVLF